MKVLAILGASGHGTVLADIALLSGYEKVVFFDDAWPDKTQIGVWGIVGSTDALLNSLDQFDGCIVGIGNNSIRREKQILLERHQAPLIKLIHPSAVISSFATVGLGSTVMANAVINPFAKVAQGCIVNTAATIDHDCSIGAFCHLSPGVNLAGGVYIDIESWVGIGATVKQCVNLGQNVIVGAGAVVVNDVPNDVTVIGCPAVPIRNKDH